MSLQLEPERYLEFGIYALPTGKFVLIVDDLMIDVALDLPELQVKVQNILAQVTNTFTTNTEGTTNVRTDNPTE